MIITRCSIPYSQILKRRAIQASQSFADMKAQLDLERERFAFETQKATQTLAFEREKLALEEQRFRFEREREVER